LKIGTPFSLIGWLERRRHITRSRSHRGHRFACQNEHGK